MFEKLENEGFNCVKFKDDTIKIERKIVFEIEKFVSFDQLRIEVWNNKEAKKTEIKQNLHTVRGIIDKYGLSEEIVKKCERELEEKWDNESLEREYERMMEWVLEWAEKNREERGLTHYIIVEEKDGEETMLNLFETREGCFKKIKCIGERLEEIKNVGFEKREGIIPYRLFYGRESMRLNYLDDYYTILFLCENGNYGFKYKSVEAYFSTVEECDDAFLKIIENIEKKIRLKYLFHQPDWAEDLEKELEGAYHDFIKIVGLIPFANHQKKIISEGGSMAVSKECRDGHCIYRMGDYSLYYNKNVEETTMITKGDDLIFQQDHSATPTEKPLTKK